MTRKNSQSYLCYTNSYLLFSKRAYLKSIERINASYPQKIQKIQRKIRMKRNRMLPGLRLFFIERDVQDLSNMLKALSKKINILGESWKNTRQSN